MDDLKKCKNKLERTLAALKDAEHLLENKSRELYNLNQSLEAEVKKRVQDYEQAKDEAIAASKAKDRFVANMNHELRTPLNGIIGMVNLLKNTELNLEQLDYVKTIEKSGDILLSIINDVLEHSKIQAGKTQVELTEFDLEHIIENVADIMYYKAYEKGIHLNVMIDDNYPKRFMSDQKKISQILINLIGNSIKFTPKGEINIYLKLAKSGIQIDVEDSGIGISKEKLEEIFSPFSQADNSDTRKYGGSGLGLSICKDFAEALGGNIKVKSQEGKSTTFSFTIKNQIKNESKDKPIEFPKTNIALAISNHTLEKSVNGKLNSWSCNTLTTLNINDINADTYNKKDFKLIVDDTLLDDKWVTPKNCELHILCHMINTQEIKDKFPKANLIRFPFHRNELLDVINYSAKTNKQSKPVANVLPETDQILLVEDNFINQKVAEQILTKAGFKVDLANNGQEALNFIEKRFYPIILMDFNMPVMDGVESTKHIREFQKNSNQKSYIMAMTASAMRYAKESCFNAGMDDFITKPVDAEHLVDTIKRIIAINKKVC